MKKKLRNEKVIRRMSLAQKCVLLSGHGKWDTWELKRPKVPAMILSDGPHGVRRQSGLGDHLGFNESLPATCFPTAAALANSWDESLCERVGEALGEEAVFYGVNVLLGPGVNIKRSPLCGRNFEYFSEDPILTGRMASGLIRGIQSKGIYACVKHFAANNQEDHRMTENSVVDERTLREIYLPAFEMAVKEGKVKALMTSYNMVNGVYANENKKLLGNILRREWGFDGLVVSDWGGSNHHVRGVIAGSTLEMPSSGFFSAMELLTAVKRNKLPESIVDRRVDELLTAVFETEIKEKTEAEENKDRERFWQEPHHALAREAAEKCIVLLKNTGDILPLAEGLKVVLIGDFAFKPRYQGAGSSAVNSTQVDDMRDILKEENGIELVGCARGYMRSGLKNLILAEEALSLAKEADVVIYCFGLTEGSEAETVDRRHMRLPKNQTELLREISDVNPNVIGVLSGGSAVEAPWEDDLAALLYVGLSGQAGAGAAIDVIMGRVNPSGRLAESWPYSYEDTPAYNYFPVTEKNPAYREGLYVGYRYYNTADVPVRYCFGYGLSYTKFEYSDIIADEKGVTVSVKNIGDRDGETVVQMYISKRSRRIFRPAAELKGFKKIFLAAGEERTVSIPFDDRTFSFYNTASKSFETEGGSYTVMIGESALDIRLRTRIRFTGNISAYPYEPGELPSYFSGRIRHVPRREYRVLYGREDVFEPGEKGAISMNDAIHRLNDAKNGAFRKFASELERRKKEAEDKGMPDLNLHFVSEMPLRSLAQMTDGLMDKNMVKGLISAANGRFLKGMGELVNGFRKKRSYEGRFRSLLRHRKK